MGVGAADDRGVGSLSSIVSDASALIALSQIGQLELLADLFGAVLVPPAVVRETARAVGRPAWLVEHPLARPIDPRIAQASLGPGETETIGLALELGKRAVILDERAGRRLAEAVGLHVIGAVGILLQAKRRGSLVAVRPALDALLSTGFYVSPALYRRVLTRAGAGV